MTKIVIITSGQPSLNPRLVKEADALVSNGFEVTVIYQYWNEWATTLDIQLLQGKNWKAIRVGGSPKDEPFKYLLSRIIHRLGEFLMNYFGLKNGLAEIALKRNTQALTNKAKSIPASLYIAHNLGALPAAVLACKKNRAKSGFDAEDFHRQETTDNPNTDAYQLVKFIEDKYLPQVDYLTAASPLIAEAYQQLYKYHDAIVLNNVFSLSFLQDVAKPQPYKDLNLFWFSQTIGKGRGIEDAIRAISFLKKENISLTLLGNVDEMHKSYFLTLANELGLVENQLQFIPPVQADNIFKLAAKYDIGLALEPGFCLNNNIALSNKIFTYLTAGLAVIASETLAQKDFLEHYPKVGISYPIGNIEILSGIIDRYDHDRQLLYETKLNAINYVKEELNWEVEKLKFIKLINQTLAK